MTERTSWWITIYYMAFYGNKKKKNKNCNAPRGFFLSRKLELILWMFLFSHNFERSRYFCFTLIQRLLREKRFLAVLGRIAVRRKNCLMPAGITRKSGPLSIQSNRSYYRCHIIKVNVHLFYVFFFSHWIVQRCKYSGDGCVCIATVVGFQVSILFVLFSRNRSNPI